MRIAIFDYRVVSVNPSGSCHLAMLRELCQEHEFTVFSVEFENPCPGRIRWVRIPAVKRPLILLYLTFHMLAPLLFLLQRLRMRRKFDCVQMVESNLAFGEISYAHFCHRFYLRTLFERTAPPGLRGLLRRLDHRAHAAIEPLVFRRARRIAVPSRGLARELAQEYPRAAGKINVIANPVDVLRFRRPPQFDREALRRNLGATSQDRLLVFVALGHFERKGLPQLLDALSRQQGLVLVVVGGEPSLIAAYRNESRALRVSYTGMQSDVRPFLWAADAFILPSAYETFSLVAFQAAAAGLPLIATRLHGVEEILRDGDTGLLLDGSSEGLAATLRKVHSMNDASLIAMGRAAQQAVQRFDIPHFVASWRSFYDSMNSDLAQSEPVSNRLEADIP